MQTDSPPLPWISCPTCGQVHELPPLRTGTEAHCVRCSAKLAKQTRAGLHRCAAFALAALFLYFPANLLPILRLTLYGSSSDNTVWDGVVFFWRSGEQPIAIVVLLASILIPLLKLLGLLFIVSLTWFYSPRFRTARVWLYRIIEGIGRFAMLDVFVLSIWVAIVKLDALGKVTPGKGLAPFACVVVLTLLASASFDPHMIWELAPGQRSAGN